VSSAKQNQITRLAWPSSWLNSLFRFALKVSAIDCEIDLPSGAPEKIRAAGQSKLFESVFDRRLLTRAQSIALGGPAPPGLRRACSNQAA
jgi:hypothetical protein